MLVLFCYSVLNNFWLWLLNRLEILLAWKYFISSSRDGSSLIMTLSSLFGLWLGVSMLILTLSITRGFHEDLVSRISGTSGHVFIQSSSGISDYKNLVKSITSFEEVESAFPLIVRESMILSNDNNKNNGAGVVLNAVNSNYVDKILSSKIILHDIYRDEGIEDNSVAIGDALARLLGVTVGDIIGILAPVKSFSVFGFMPRIEKYKVQSIFHFGIPDYDTTFVYMNLSEGQKLFDLKDKVNFILNYLYNPYDAVNVRRDIVHLLHNQDDVFTTHWIDKNSAYIEALDIESKVSFVTVAVIIIIASFNILTGIFILVSSRRRSIAILRTIGMTKMGIMRVFILCGLLISTVGALLGAGTGIVFIKYIDEIEYFLLMQEESSILYTIGSFFSGLPIIFDYEDAIRSVLLSLTLSLLATLLPAYDAARRSPADIIRYE